MKKMSITHVITGLNTGGAEMMLCKLISSNDWSHGTRVISLIAGGAVKERIQDCGVTVHSLNMRRGWPSLAALKRLRGVVRGEHPDVIQGWMYHGNLAASVAKRFCKGKAPAVVWNVRQSLYDLKHERPFTRWVIRVNARISGRADAIIYNSRTSARQHEAFGFDASRTRIIPNGFDTDVFYPDETSRIKIRSEMGLKEDAILIGLIARYHPMKDHLNFMRAAALLNREFPEVHFLLAGSNIDAGNRLLSSMIMELGLDKRVHLLGERKDIPQLNAALDIASSSSAWGEGFANVIGEAMSCGVSCVVTDVGDSAWIVGDIGKVVPAGAPEALATAWKELLALDHRGRQALGMRGRQRVIENFSLGVVVKKYEHLYESLTAPVKD